MKKIRPMIAGLLAMLLILSALPAYPAHADTGGTGAGDIPAGKVMIKNKWKSNVLYEDSNGIVRYGLTHPTDESAHWIVETEGGISRIKNSKTGNYISLSRTTQRNQPLTTLASADTAGERWIIDKSNRDGFMVVRSASVPEGNLVIHEEDQLGFAEASSDINITFESPQWAFISVDDAVVRIESLMRPGNVIFEQDGQVKHGVKAADDPSAQWLLEQDGSGRFTIRNKATGHVILQNETTWAGILTGDSNSGKPGLSLWNMADATSQPGFVVFENVGMPGNWMNPQFPDDDAVRSNDWAGGADGVNALWKIKPVSELPAVRIGAYTDAKAAADFLYEDNGAVKHGAISGGSGSSDARYLWIVEDYDTSKRIRNAATNHYLNIDGDLLMAGPVSVTEATYEWSFTASEDYDDYKTIENKGVAGQYIAVGAGDSVIVSGDAGSLGAQWELIDPSLPVDGSESYIRIQNSWQPFYLYENQDGTLKYGNPRKDDQRDQWLVVKHQGRKLFQNRETGHYMNIADMPDGHIQVTPLADVGSVPDTYIWSAKNLGGGTYLISSVSDKVSGEPFSKFISLQNLTKYAEYGVINPNWGSPQWRFLPVTEQTNPYFRFKLKNGDGLYLKDAEGIHSAIDATYGASDDDYSVWFLQESGGSGAVIMKNKGSGRSLSIQNLAEAQVEAEDEPALPVETRTEVYEVWGSIKWVTEPKPGTNEVTIKSGWTGHYLYAAEDEEGSPIFKVSRAPGANERAEAAFIAEPVTIAEQPIPDTPVRIKSATGDSYLYEHPGDVVLYGDLAADNGYSHWTIMAQDNGTKLIRNRATGHYLTLTEDYTFLESSQDSPAADGASGWSVTRSEDGVNVTIRSQYGNYDDEYIHLQNNTGYAERGLLPSSWGSVQWSLFPAPEEFKTPEMAEPRNLNTATPVQDDTNKVTISPKGQSGKVLAEAGGKLVYADAASAKTSGEWLMQDFNGRHLLKNIATGHYLALNERLEPAVAASGKALNSQWNVGEKLGYFTLSNVKASGKLLDSAQGADYGEGASPSEGLWRFESVASDVKYSASDAFSGDNVLRFAVHGDHAGEYDGVIRYRNDSGAEGRIQLVVNGYPQQEILLAKEGSWKTADIKLNLRSGMNSVSLERTQGSLKASVIDSMTVKNSINKNYRGATVPYVSYEAEDGESNGSIVGPSRKFRSIASEASGRRAVSLNESGDFVEFSLAKPANSLVLRYSIPDSADGQGADETLSLYVNGVFKQTLNLTSKYAWEYGSYPWSNDPRQGSGHRFFDETHALIGDVPAGAVIKLQKDAGDRAESYIIDLVEMEQVEDAYGMPAEGFLSVTDFGAVPNDGMDDTAAFKDALAAAANQGKGVWFPEGTFDFGDELLDLESAVIRGAGMWHTTMNGAKFFGHGGKVEVYDLLIDGGINVRDDEAVTNAFHGAFGPGSVIQHVWIEHTKAGLWLTQTAGETARTNGLYMMGLRIRNLMADGINFAVGTGNSMMEQSDIRYPGDDGIAMWSFTDPKLGDVNGAERTPSVNNTARFNTVTLPWLADNIVVFGGKDNKIQDNLVKDTVTNGAGIAVSTRFNAEPFEGTTVVERNTLIRTGSYDTGYGVSLGALWLFAGESNMNGKVVVRDNVTKDSTYSGLIMHGDFAMNDVLLQNLVIDRAGTHGVDVTSNLKGSATVDNVIVRGDRMKMVSNPAAGFAFKEINQGFASAKKPVVDPGGPEHPGNPGNSGGGNGSGSGSGGGSSATTPSTTGTTSFDDQLNAALTSGQSRIEIKTDDQGNASLHAGALLAAASSRSDAILSVVDTAATAEVRFPLSYVEGILNQAGVSDANQAIVKFSLTKLADSEQAQSGMAQAAVKQGLKQQGNAAEFRVAVIEGEKETPISRYGPGSVERLLTLEGTWNPQTAVGLFYDPSSGTLRYVPALFKANPDGSTTVTFKTDANGIFTVAVNERTFSDLAGHWAGKDIEKLASRMIVNGFPDGRFGPGQSLTRAEFAAMLVRALDLRSGQASDRFGDVNSGDWFREAASAAAEAGLIQGYADGTFRPNAEISREEMAVMAGRALKLLDADGDLPSATTLGSFRNAARLQDWAREDVQTLLDAGIIQGQSKDRFAPQSISSRAEAAVVLSRLLVRGQFMNP
ncbi:polygalacturonase [Fontibacillus phaseoli]|uniref:Polygalacturonase n=1 Tax=Fontibacillus phaseoli TaxID=1416533 RepID=A0A369BGD9_9BACL|nr:S-layer homology domain-containing protein [Fontibacillus phaseoli]RCX20619.1 polygalacturonase [Fontibacillus phaseoli]